MDSPKLSERILAAMAIVGAPLRELEALAAGAIALEAELEAAREALEKALPLLDHRNPNCDPNLAFEIIARAAPPPTKGEDELAASLAHVQQGLAAHRVHQPQPKCESKVCRDCWPDPALSGFVHGAAEPTSPAAPGKTEAPAADPIGQLKYAEALALRAPPPATALEKAGETLAAALEHCNGRRCGNAPVIAAVGDCLRGAQREQEELRVAVERAEANADRYAKAVNSTYPVQMRLTAERDATRADLATKKAELGLALKAWHECEQERDRLKERLGAEVARCHNAEAFAREYRGKVKEVLADRDTTLQELAKVVEERDAAIRRAGELSAPLPAQMGELRWRLLRLKKMCVDNGGDVIERRAVEASVDAALAVLPVQHDDNITAKEPCHG